MALFHVIAFIAALSVAVGLWNRFFGLLLIADDPAPTSSYPVAPNPGPRILTPLTDCPKCGTYAYHLFTPHASVSQCGYDVKMMGRECVLPGCVGEWSEEWDVVSWERSRIKSRLRHTEKALHRLRGRREVEPQKYDRLTTARKNLLKALEVAQ